MNFIETLTDDNLLQLLNNEEKTALMEVPTGELAAVDHLATCFHTVERAIERLKASEREIVRNRKMLEYALEEAQNNFKSKVSSMPESQLKGNLIKFSVSQSAPKLIVTNLKEIPEEYFNQVVTKELDKSRLKEQLLLGDTVPGADIERGLTLKTLANKGV